MLLAKLDVGGRRELILKFPKNFDDNKIERVRIVNIFTWYSFFVQRLSIIFNFSVDIHYEL